ncbi:Fumarylacetoacetate hydrolase domain-containing protein 2 [Fulvia fulva]|nr:Fumarylacetoacetate hydrolase domain-containing protein 2 [Fulvia fulva]KAK4625597.1 Fumarylacetoacetate hydrolase domain-containing protein 2 [Fulvia fulva]WPV15630.1 Fumarylacetoacetate hydrolase domain-containing protein 2 [Fulvia fulva]
MKAIFRRLIRFQDAQGKICYGEAPENLDALEGSSVDLYIGTEPWDLEPSGTTARVAKILCPLATTPIIYGIGLIYKAHIEEAGFPVPKFPVYFSKPPDALAAPNQDIAIPRYIEKLDYEGELCFVIGRDVRDFGQDDNVADYIIGFMAGNDVSAREWQTQETAGGQHHVAKSFDHFAPVGPVLASYEAIPQPEALRLQTLVNGNLRQDTRTDDLLFTLKDIMVHLTLGKTLRKGTVVMTGTPSGVAAFMKPPVWLEDGDVVEVRITGLGTLRNKHVFKL